MEQHTDFLGAAIDLSSRLDRSPEAEVLQLRLRATSLVQRFGSWASSEPSLEERSEAVGELLSLNREVNEYLLRKRKRCACG